MRLLLQSTTELVAMGVSCRIEIVAPNCHEIVQECIDELHQLEQLWSRFIPTSDITQLNNALGCPVTVHPRTTLLIQYMKTACDATNEAFNPTRLPEQIERGDDQSLQSANRTVIPSDAHSFSSMDEVEILDGATVQLPPKMTLDAGGIGKGLAADILCDTAINRGASSVSINLGGDIRVANTFTSTRDWPIDVLPPHGVDAPTSTVSIRNGAIATSDRHARLRSNAGIDSHIQGANSAVAGASVIASHGVWAEVWTKYLMQNPHSLDELNLRGLAGRVVLTNGDVVTTPQWKEFERC